MRKIIQTEPTIIPMPARVVVDQAAEAYRSARIAKWDRQAESPQISSPLTRYYHRRLLKIYQTLIPKNSKVLEIGCGKGHLLAGLEPSIGVGVDFSEKMIDDATATHTGLTFIQADAHSLDLDETFDYIILSDLINDLWNMQGVLEQLDKVCTKDTRVILNNYNRFWELPLVLIGKLNLGNPQLQKNWLSSGDLENLLRITGYKTVHQWEEILLPLNIFGITSFVNRCLVKVWPFNLLGLTKFIVARPMPQSQVLTKNASVSIIVPARNEEGHVNTLFERLPQFENPFELVFVEGHSSDNTYTRIEAAITENPEISCRLFRQQGKGKKDAVELGIRKSEGDIIVILDADLTVAPEDLPRVLNVIQNGRGEFINGVRMVYPQEKDAMRFFNLLGNKFFAWFLSRQLGQRVGDALCGTKVFWKKDYEKFSNSTSYLGDHDPFGDFSLLFGAADLSLEITDVPIRYRKRAYGVTNIQRWRDGWKLFQLVIKGALRIRFI